MSKNLTRRSSQRDLVLAHLKSTGMARSSEIMGNGVTASTISRLEQEGVIVRLARGLYQLADAQLDVHHTLAEAAKLVPRGVICLTSALAFHGLTDQFPPKVWMAIGPKAWGPRIVYPPIRFVRFPDSQREPGVDHHLIDGVAVPIFGVAKTIADMFRYRRTVGINVAVEGLRKALVQRRASPAEIAKQAVETKIWGVMEPYVSALTSSD